MPAHEMAEAAMTSGAVPAGARFAPVLVAVCALAGVAVWLVVRHPGDVVLGNVGGSVVLLSAAAACYGASRGSRMPWPERAFWRLWSYSAATLFLSTIAAIVATARGETGMPLYEAVPTLVSLTFAMLAFRHVPLNQ